MAQTSNSRFFTPEPPIPSDILYYDSGAEISRIRLRGKNPIVVFIAGECRGNGTPSAKAAFGVYFGKDCRYNYNGSTELLPYWATKTRKGAELFAAQLAIETIQADFEQEACDDGVVVITDSEYLVRAFTRHINEWVQTGYMGADGRSVENWHCFDLVNNTISDMEKLGVKIRFWRVDRADNEDAVRLANDGYDPKRRSTEHGFPGHEKEEELLVCGSSLEFSNFDLE